MNHLTAQDLIAFEDKVCESFKNKEIRAPVHLYYGNEAQMIEIFKRIKPLDWVFCSWRSHYQCLLKGVPQDKLLEDIKQGRSISLNYPEQRVFSSAIVGGSIPIANGVALSCKRRQSVERVFCFLGDMTSETGCFYENWKYSMNFDLPITWIIEDNGKSVCTDTKKTWNEMHISFEPTVHLFDNGVLPIREERKIIYYKYETKYPHAGTGERIQF